MTPGIGRAVALAFAREGADVLISYLPEEEQDGQETVRLVEEAGRAAVAVPGDLGRGGGTAGPWCSGPSTRSGASTCWSATQPTRCRRPGGLEDITTEQLDRVVKTNLYALFWLCKAALPHVPPGGSIIAPSSVQAFSPSPHLLDYATTKGGIVTFTKGLAAQLAEKGIRVNSVAPGPVWTPLILATIPGEHLGDVRRPDTAGPGRARPSSRRLRVPGLGRVGVHDRAVLGATGGPPITSPCPRRTAARRRPAAATGPCCADAGRGARGSSGGAGIAGEAPRRPRRSRRCPGRARPERPRSGRRCPSRRSVGACP